MTGLNKEERAQMVKTLILERLPEDNYILLKYLAQFLAKVRLPFITFLKIHKYKSYCILGSRQKRHEQNDIL